MAVLLDESVYVFRGFSDGFFDACGVDASILDEFLEGGFGDLFADGVEAGDDDGTECVIDDEVAAGGFFEGSYIASFASDDASFYVIGWECNGSDSCL